MRGRYVDSSVGQPWESTAWWLYETVPDQETGWSQSVVCEADTYQRGLPIVRVLAQGDLLAMYAARRLLYGPTLREQGLPVPPVTMESWQPVKIGA